MVLCCWCCVCGVSGASSGWRGGRCRRLEQSDRCACGRCRCGAKKMTNEDINAKQPLRVKSVKLMVVAIVQSWIMQSFCISQNMKIPTSQKNSNYNSCTFQLATICWCTARLVHRSGTTPTVKMCISVIYAYIQNTNRFQYTHWICWFSKRQSSSTCFFVGMTDSNISSREIDSRNRGKMWGKPWRPGLLAVNPWRKCKNMGVSKNRGGPPKRMVKICENNGKPY